MKKNGSFFGWCTVLVLTVFSMVQVQAMPARVDKTKYHTWDEVEAYLYAIGNDPELSDIVELIPIGSTREGKQLKILRISKEGILGKEPDTKPAALIMGAHHAREHISKEAVLALIDKLIHGYGKSGAEGSAITYLVNAGTFYLLPWVNPDGGMSEFLHNPEQRKTNTVNDEPQIGAADCDTCGDGAEDEDSPDIVEGDVGIQSLNGNWTAFPDNGIISRQLQLWYEDENYTLPVVDERVGRIQPGGSVYTFNYEGADPDSDGDYGPYSGEDFVGGVDPNRNYGSPAWGDCDNDEGCSFLSGAQTYCGPSAFSEPETAAVAAFLRLHPNISTLESLHSGVNEIYPPWWIFPDDPEKETMDESYQDSVAQYIASQTGYEVLYGGQYSVNGDTTGYSYIGSGQNLGIDFWPGGVLSFTTEIYGMGSDSGSAEAVRDWFPHHWQQFDTNYPQGIFIAWSDFPWCTTCDPGKVYDPSQASRPWWDYTQYMEYFIFTSNGKCDGQNASGIFHCDYWGVGGSQDYYADLDIFAYFNPPAANRCYEDWNCDGKEIVRTVDRQLKHLMYRLYIAPFIKIGDVSLSGDGTQLTIPIENTGFLRSSIMTASLPGADPFSEREYTYGAVDVTVEPDGFSLEGNDFMGIGWLGGGHPDDPESSVKYAVFNISGIEVGDQFTVTASSDKTGSVKTTFRAVEDQEGGIRFHVAASNFVDQSANARAYFLGKGPDFVKGIHARTRSVQQIRADMARAEKKRKLWKRIEGPFDVLQGYVKGIKVKKYH